jgi:glycosyltransferase involved in cell wall biosynthesis
MSTKKLKIILISDFSRDQSPGGAQVSNDLIIKEGLNRGHDITLHNYDSSPTNFLTNYDIVISSNLEAISSSNSDIIDFIIDHPMHIRLEHDSCLYLSTQDRLKLFQSSKLNFFLSQYHLDFFTSMYGDIFGNTKIVNDPMNTDLFFKNESTEKIYDIVYCGLIHELKGIKRLLEFAVKNPNRRIDIFGWGGKNMQSIFKKYSNVNFNGKIDHHEMPKVFQSSKSVFHSPVVNEPFCRMVGEAILCGVEDIIGSPEKIGSYLEYKRLGLDQFKKNCRDALGNFWNAVENVI